MICLLIGMVLASTWRSYVNVSLQEEDYSGDLLGELAVILGMDDLYIEELSSRRSRNFIIHCASNDDKDELEKRILNTSKSKFGSDIDIKEVTIESREVTRGCTELMIFNGQINDYQELSIFITAERFHVRVHGPNRWNAVGLGTSMTNVDAWIFSVNTFTVQEYYLTEKNITGSIDAIQNLEQLKVAGGYDNYTWEFWRERETGDEKDMIVDCNQQMFISFAVGTGDGQVVSYHGQNRGDLLITLDIINSIFPAPVLWDADINDVFTPITIGLMIATPLGVLALFSIAHRTKKVAITDIIVGIVVCGQDAVSDYLLVGEWFIEENY